MNNILILNHSNTEERCTAIEGSFCVQVQLRGLCIERETAMKLMSQLPLCGKAPTQSKLLPYNASLSDIFSAGDVESGKFRCKLCDKTLSRKTTRKHVGIVGNPPLTLSKSNPPLWETPTPFLVLS